MITKSPASVTLRSLSFGLAAFFPVQWAAVGIFVFLASPRVVTAASDRPTIYRSGDVEKPPIPKREKRIRFSRAQRKEQAEIKLRFVVTPEGKTAQITIVTFSDPTLVGPAFAAYENAEYDPGIKDGQPVNCWVEVTESAK